MEEPRWPQHLNVSVYATVLITAIVFLPEILWKPGFVARNLRYRLDPGEVALAINLLKDFDIAPKLLGQRTFRVLLVCSYMRTVPSSIEKRFQESENIKEKVVGLCLASLRKGVAEAVYWNKPNYTAGTCTYQLSATNLRPVNIMESEDTMTTPKVSKEPNPFRREDQTSQSSRTTSQRLSSLSFRSFSGSWSSLWGRESTSRSHTDLSQDSASYGCIPFTSFLPGHHTISQPARRRFPIDGEDNVSAAVIPSESCGSF